MILRMFYRPIYHSCISVSDGRGQAHYIRKYIAPGADANASLSSSPWQRGAEDGSVRQTSRTKTSSPQLTPVALVNDSRVCDNGNSSSDS